MLLSRTLCTLTGDQSVPQMIPKKIRENRETAELAILTDLFGNHFGPYLQCSIIAMYKR
jgi:mannose/fructose-specific phosphotransferase system component IIA